MLAKNIINNSNCNSILNIFKLRVKQVGHEIICFILSNIILLIFLAASIFILILDINISSIDIGTSPHFEYLDVLGGTTKSYKIVSTFSNLGMAYIASTIFYIVNQYIPSRREIYKNNLIINNELTALYESIVNFITFNDFVFKKDLEQNESDIYNIKAVDKEYIIKINEHKRWTADAVVKIHQYQYYNALAERIINLTNSIKNKNLKLDKDLLKIFNDIDNNIILAVYKRISQPSKISENGVMIEYDKALINLKEMPNKISIYIDKWIKYCPEIQIALEEEYIETMKFFVFKFKSSHMLLDNKYIEKSLSYIKELYKNSTIESNNIEDANKQLLEYIKIFDDDHIIIDKFMDDVLNFSKLILISSPPEDRALHYINMLQIKKRLNIKFSDSERAIMDKILLQQDNYTNFGIYVILDDLNNAKKCYDKLSDDELKSMPRTPIYNLFSRLRSKFIIECDIDKIVVE